MNLNPYIAVIIAAVLAGSSGVFIKLLNLPPASITFFRLFIPVIILFCYFRWKQIKLFKGNYKIMLLASSLNAIRIFLYFVAYLFTSIGNAVIILFTWPIFAAIFGAVLLKEKVTLREFSLIFIAFIGIFIMYMNKEISFGDKDFIGMVAMLLSSIIFSLTILIYKKELPNYSKEETIFYQNFIGSIIFLPFIFINRPFPTLIQTSVASLYGLLIGIVVFLLFFYGLNKLKVSHYSLFTYFEVPSALVFSFIFFKEMITLNMFLGGLLIVASGFLLKRKKELIQQE